MKLKSFDNYLFSQLRDPEFALLYLNEAYADSVEEFLLALHKYVQANGGIDQTAEFTHFSRESLTALLSDKGNPDLRSLRAILHSLGFGFTVGRLDRSLHAEDAQDQGTVPTNRMGKELAAASG